LPETGNDHTGKIVKWTVDSEHAVVVKRKREETQKDPKMQKVVKRIVKADWEEHRRNRDVEPFIYVKDYELSVAEGLIFNSENNEVSQSVSQSEPLQRKVVRVGHKLGHLGKTKTKRC
jgi:hypothetical protein